MQQDNLIRRKRKRMSSNDRRIEVEVGRKSDADRLLRAEWEWALIAGMVARRALRMMWTAIIHRGGHLVRHYHFSGCDFGSPLRRLAGDRHGRSRGRQHCHRQGDHQGHHHADQSHSSPSTRDTPYHMRGPHRQASGTARTNLYTKSRAHLFDPTQAVLAMVASRLGFLEQG